MTKTCFKCNKTKPLDDFYKHPMMADGRLGKCKECAKKDVRENRLKRAEQYAEYERKRYAEMGHRYTVPHLEYRNEWRKQTGKGREYNSKYRGLKMAAIGTFTAEEFEWLCIDHSHQCLDCGSYNKPLTADHVIPLSKGGTNTIDNIQPLCGPCNSRKGTKTIDFRN